MISIDLLRERISTLEAQLLEKTPEYKTSLEDIRRILHGDPELLHMLRTDTELSVVFSAMKAYKQIEIPIVEAKKKATSIPKGPISLDAF